MSLVDNLVDSRNRAWNEAKAVIDGADAEKRSLTAEESEKYDRIMADIDANDARITQTLEAEKRSADLAEARSKFTALPSAEAETATESVAGKYFRSLEGADNRGGIEFRVQTKGSATGGGNSVPTGFLNELIATQVANSNILSANPRFLDTDSGEDIEVPLVTGYGAAVATAENATAAAADDAFGSATMHAFKYEVFVQVSNELLTDAGVDIEAWIAGDAGRKLANAYGALLVTGGGTTVPQGVITASTNAVTAASASLTWDNMIDLQEALVPQHQAKAVWLMNQSTRAALRKLKDGVNGRYMYDISTVPGIPDTILGRPVVVDPNVAAIGTGVKSVAIFNPDVYLVRRVNGVRFERSDHFAFDKDLVTFRALVRLDGQSVDTSGFKSLVHA